MPQVGNKCPGLQEYHSFESRYCLNSCDHQCVPASVLVHIGNRVRVDKHIGRYISVTSLLGCLRQLYLERTLEYFIEPPKAWWSLRGTILHRILEKPGMVSLIEDMKHEVYRLLKSGEGDKEEIEGRWIELEAQLADFAELLPMADIPNWNSETEYEYPVGYRCVEGCKRFISDRDPNRTDCPYCGCPVIELVSLRGTIDVLRHETGEIYDYKTIGDRGLSIIKNGAKEDHITQFNLYRLLVERGWPIGAQATYQPIKINKITAFYMTMMQIARTGGLLVEQTDWRVSDPLDHPNLRGTPEVLGEKQKLALRRGKRKATATPDDYDLQTYKKFRLTYAVPDVPLLDLDAMEKFVQDTVPILIDAFHHGKMPPMCAPEMRLWKCEGYCADQIRQACDAHNAVVGDTRIVEVEDDNMIPVEAA